MTKYVAASPKYDKMIQEHEKNRIGFDRSRPRILYPRVGSGWLHISRRREYRGLEDLVLGQA